MMAHSLAELRALSDDEVISRYDGQARTTGVGLDHWLNEMDRRYQERHTDSMYRFTKWITLMTIVVTVATLINVGIAMTVLIVGL